MFLCTEASCVLGKERPLFMQSPCPSPASRTLAWRRYGWCFACTTSRARSWSSMGRARRRPATSPSSATRWPSASTYRPASGPLCLPSTSLSSRSGRMSSSSRRHAGGRCSRAGENRVGRVMARGDLMVWLRQGVVLVSW